MRVDLFVYYSRKNDLYDAQYFTGTLTQNELKAEIEQDLPEIPYVFISSVAQQGLTELKDMLWKYIDKTGS